MATRFPTDIVTAERTAKRVGQSTPEESFHAPEAASGEANTV